MKNYIILIIAFSLFLFSCKTKKEEKNTITEQKTIENTSIIKDSIKVIPKRNLKKTCDYKKLLKTFNNVKHTGNKHQDWMTNNSSHKLATIFNISVGDFLVKTTSYTYKKDCVFYLHTLSHTNDSISIKPFLENALGKRTEGYTKNRILVFTMKNDKVANFIDIPANWNYIELREELLDTLYKKIDSDIILCNRFKKCVYKDLRK